MGGERGGAAVGLALCARRERGGSMLRVRWARRMFHQAGHICHEADTWCDSTWCKQLNELTNVWDEDWTLSCRWSWI